MTQMKGSVILEAVHTPFAKAGGAFREVRPDTLLAQTLDGLMTQLYEVAPVLVTPSYSGSSLYNVQWDSSVPTSL
jgi:acetyl-CoA acetyltransferase